MLLRIEDIDTVRCTPELETQMLRDLEWIGFEWDEEPRRQSHHFDEYIDAINQLKERGLVYPALLTRSQINDLVAAKFAAGENWPRDPDGSPVYPGRERNLDTRERRQVYAGTDAYAIRLDMDGALDQLGPEITWNEQNVGKVFGEPKAWGDVVLARKDTPTSYHLACVLDDALQEITHIVRGRDLFEATSVHTVLQLLFGLSQPVYHHHKLITDNTGKKLSKSEKPRGLKALRESGVRWPELEEMLFADSLT